MAENTINTSDELHDSHSYFSTEELQEEMNDSGADCTSSGEYRL